MGPIGTPTKVTSYEEFENTYGGFINGYFTNLAVRAFFLNGGKQCWISRTVHYTDITSSSTQTAVKGAVTLPTSGGEDTAGEITGTVIGPWELSTADTLIGNTDGVGNQTASFTAVAAELECGNPDTTPFNFTGGGQTLTVKINQGSVQTITFVEGDFATPATATAEEVAAAINARIIGARAYVTNSDYVTIQTDRQGTGSYIEVTGGTANTILDFSTSEVQGSGNVSDISAVTISEVETIVEAAFTNGGGVAVTSDSGKVKISSVTLGSGGSIRIDSTSTTATVFGFTTDTTYSGTDSAAQDTLTMTATYYGDYTSDMSIKIADASNADSGKFNLSVITSTETLETFVNLSMDSDDDRYAVDYINDEDFGSIYFTASDEEAAGATEEVIRPANTSGASVTGGDSGLTDLADTDFTGDLDAKTGIYAMNDADDLTLVSCPERTSTTVQNIINTYCSATRNRQVVAILDPPASQTASEIVTHKQALTATESGALYWPRIKILNPSTTVFGNDSQLTVPPSGHLAGMYARNDANNIEGPFYQPAGTDGVGSLYGAVDLETTEAVDPNKLDLVYPERINPITYLRNHGIHADGTRTLKGTGNFPSIGERRGVSYIEWQLNTGLQWVRHRNNTPALRRKVERQVKGLLFGWMKRNAFQSMNPATAYFVDVSDALNTASVVRSGKLKIRIGLATNTPTDWVLIDVTKDTRALEEELLAAGA
jgi:hypothetical protein